VGHPDSHDLVDHRQLGRQRIGPLGDQDMAAKIESAGGTVASFSNAPQANNDTFSINEDNVALVGNTLGKTIISLDVMANDQGGAAKSLFSLDDGTSASTATKNYAPVDLTAMDAITNGVSAWEPSGTAGIMIRINAITGKIEVDLTGYLAAYGWESLDAMGPSDSINESFTYAIKLGNGTLSWATANLSIQGVNDAAVIGGMATGTVDEDASPNTATGTLTAADVDNPDNVFLAESGTTAHGSFAIDVDGNWTYTLDNGDADVDALNDSDTLPDSFTVHSADGTAQTVNITITGTNDAAIIAGDTGGTVDEDAASDTTGGTLTAADVDNEDNVFIADSGTTAHGSYTIDAEGNWTYTLDNGDADVDALNDSDTLPDSFVVHSVDGTAQTVSITITGTNDAAVIAGDTSGTVDEDAVPNTTTGTLTAADVDNPDNVFLAESGTTAHGSYAIDADGNWTYTLDNGDADVDALNDSDTLPDSFVVHSADGTEQTVSITITGTNDAAVIAGDTGGTIDEDAASDTTGGTLTAADVDNPDNVFIADSGTTAHGSYTIDAEGNWTYTLDNGDADVDALNDSDTLPDSFAVHSVDGTAQTVSITITGTNDAAVIAGDTSGTVDEDAVPNTTTGTLTAADVDNPDNVFIAASGSTAHGSYAIDADGNWTYTLDNGDAAVDALNDSDTLPDSFVVHSADGTAQTVSITITGTTPPPEGPPPGPVDTGGPTSIVVDTLTTPGNDLAHLVKFAAIGDPDAGATVNWSIGAGSSPGFTIGSDGQVAANSVATGNSTLVVVATDAANSANVISQTFNVWIGTNSGDGSTASPIVLNGAGNNIAAGVNGDDVISGSSGFDYIVGGSNDDTIIGGGGADILVGSNGRDTFKYGAVSDSAPAAGDTILDFTGTGGSSDKIDLGGVYSGTLGFVAAQTSSFTANNQVTWYETGGNTIVQVNTDGDNSNAEMVITLTGVGKGLDATDFILT
jgi:VCBS repeat-containing protein